MKHPSKFDELARRLLDKYPSPPRKFSYLLPLYSIINISVFLFVITGIIGIIVGFYALNRYSDSMWTSRISPFIALTGGVVFLLLPLYIAWRNTFALCFGRKGEAKIIKITGQYPAMNRSINPITSGTYLAQTENRVFYADFRLEYAWIFDIHEGDNITILVHSKKDKFLLEINA